MATTLLSNAGAGTTGPWFNIRVVSRGADLAKRFHAWGSYNEAITIEGSHLVDDDSDVHTLGTIAPGGGDFDLLMPIERVRAKTGATQAPGTGANVQLSMGY